MKITLLVFSMMAAVSFRGMCSDLTAQIEKNKLIENPHMQVLLKSYNNFAIKLVGKWNQSILKTFNELSPEVREVLCAKSYDIVSDMQKNIQSGLDPIFNALRYVLKNPARRTEGMQSLNMIFMQLSMSCGAYCVKVSQDLVSKFPEREKYLPLVQKWTVDVCNMMFDGLVELFKAPENRVAVAALLAEEAVKPLSAA